MGKKKDLTGQRFGRLVVIEEGPPHYTSGNNRQVCWICKCDCGKIKTITASQLLNGNVKSCGCLKREMVANKNKKENTFINCGDYYQGIDCNGNIFLFDAEDYEAVKQYYWCVDIYGYAVAHPVHNNNGIRLHRFVLGVADTSYPIVDHISNNRVDCRKCNLRLVSYSENSMNVKIKSNNTSGTTGVHWNKIYQKWEASICVYKDRIFLGRYDNISDAIDARKKAEEQYFGDYSYSNSQEIAKTSACE